MMHKLVSAVLLSAVSAGALALGLGNIQLNSGLNQPFDARIVLLSPSASELDSLVIRLADAEAFGRAGIERAFALTSLRFEVQQNEAGDDYIRISSREPMREPFLNFLIEASWSNGKLFREYTVLLDPPLYDPNAGRGAVTTNVEPIVPAAPAQSVESTPPAVDSGADAGPVSSGFSASEVGPVAASDTLWSVASRVRPDDSVSVNQMMLALLRANPEAFIGNNINGLRQGEILRVPDLAEVSQTSYQAALDEVRSQNAMWEDIRSGIAANTTTRPVTTAVEPVGQTPASTATAETTDSGSELRLLAANDQTVTTGETGAGSGGSGSDTGLMTEQMESLTSENADLRDRLTESEQIIQDLRRLIELKDDELATMQQQIGDASAAEPVDMTTPGEVETTAGQSVAEDETVTDAEAQSGVTENAADGTATAEESIEVTDAGDVSGAVEDEQPAAEEMVEEPVAEEPSEPAPMIAVDSAPASGLVDQILGFIFGNIMLVGGGLIIIILALLVPSLIRKRREAASEPGQDALAGLPLPDFEASSADADTADGPQMDMDIDKDMAESDVMSAAAGKSAETDEYPQAVPLDIAPSAAGTGEEDPLAEVNVFLAYEHFDQAEEFVRDAISRQPENLDFHSKLLEVFYSAGDKGKYEQEARELQELTGGAGPHWDMATIMWQEMSPNRPLFSEPAEGEEDSRAEITGSGRGIVDLTADDDSVDDSALDFDLGVAMADSTPAASDTSGSDGMLDITAGSQDVLDVTASESSVGDEDILDVTAAVGLDTNQAADDGLSFELPASDEQDILDISASGTTDNPLDVTAHADLEADQDENLLDISITGAIGDSTASAADDNLLDFDVAGLSDSTATASETAESENDNGLEMDFGSQMNTDDDGPGLSLDSGDDGDSGLEFPLDSDTTDNDGGLELDFAGDDDSAAGTDGGLELDMGADDELSAPSASGIDIDMDSTVKIPKHSEISLENFTDEDDDDSDDHTVFVPRTNDSGEQSADDENATKLDLAKAYVELGDKSNAKSILEEVIADGNAAQRHQAQELMSQI